ncbi:hypothetical protein uan_058 [Pseudomonas phage UAntarctica]|nr:hypothetical protein uan_058 [Pseudomonas phage UAntarctica]
MGKFSAQADRVMVDVSALFNRSIRQALLAGLAMALGVTKQDSSNAAVHWLLAAKSRSRPAARRYGQLRDLRGTSTRPGVAPVGKRRDGGVHAAAAMKFVRERELREVVDKLVAGRSPETVFYFYNAIEPGTQYGENANIEAAGEAAAQEVLRIFENRIASGQVRKKYK